ncbi:MAG: 4a-hydroxytetrahydrobiopterin dehydratase [Methanoculleaceae archaeon]
MDLASRHCSPRREGISPLIRREIFDLLREVPDWSYRDGRLERTFEFNSFNECLEFVDDVARISAQEGHYPDICITEGRKVTVSWYSYFCGGLTECDFILAARLSDRVRLREAGML